MSWLYLVEMSKIDSMYIRVSLEGENARRFEVVKDNLGLKQNTEVVRSLIRDAYLKIQPGAGEVEPTEVEARI